MLRLVEPHERAGHKRGGATKTDWALTVEDGDGGDRDEVVAMASVEKNTRTPLGTRLPKSDSTPSAKAISVAWGWPNRCERPAWLKDQVDAGGNDDATHGRQHGKHGLTRILELADRHLVLKLNTHQQKRKSP